MMIKAILFDIDGVLADSLKANHDFYWRILKNFGYEFVSLDEYREKYFSLAMRDVIRNFTQASSKKVEEIFKFGQDKYNYDLMDITPYVGEIIMELKSIYALGIVTGRLKIGAEGFIKKAKLENVFNVIVSYEDYQKPKPDPEPLSIALQRLDKKPENAVYIGDSLIDFQAASSLGMKFITFYGVSGKIFKEADANINNFSQLPAEIKKLS
ncbi:MAG: HAD-IA family hydrolase [Candidatus Gottesmanbacteria bacterium]